MKDVAAYIASGILEMYVLGMTSETESREVEQLAMEHAAIRAEIAEISEAMESWAQVQAKAPHATVKPLLMATLNYMQRLQAGEAPEVPPMLHQHSRIEDYRRWLDRADMIISADPNESIFARIIGHTSQAITAIVWLREGAPHEVHDNEYERFLIVEGTCDITIGDDEVHHLVPGDYLTIPLYKGHHVKVTSAIPCKVILQRVAA